MKGEVVLTGHRFNPDKAEKLLDPQRAQMLPPEKVIHTLDLKEGDVVADLGAGNGFLTIPLARQTKRTVYAVDIEPKMLELLRERAAQQEIDNIEYVQSDLENIRLDDQCVDVAISAFVLHEISDLPKAFSEMRRILKPGGKALLIDWEAQEMDMGPPLDERIPAEDMRRFLHKQGFRIKQVQFHETNYAFVVS